MPELPEVENLRQGLQKNILNQKILNVKVTKPKLVSGKGTLRKASNKKVSEFTNGTVGEKIIAVERRAKNLIFKLSNGKIIIAHLKMSGQFVYAPSQGITSKKPKSKNEKIIGGHPIEISETELPNKHSHVIFKLEKGTLYYNDTRMFGYVLYYPDQNNFDKQGHFDLYGMEPLEEGFTKEYFINSIMGVKGKSKAPAGKIKSVLMDQKIVVGLGNIYADESLFEAGIRPDRTTKSISKEEAAKLYKAIIRILKRAVEVGGSSVATYRLLDNTRGNYAREHKVYGKAGEPCVKCKSPLKKIIIGGRTTVFCANCQK